MYKRLDEETARRNRNSHEKDDAYRIVYDTLDWVSDETENISPEELWTEASAVIDEIRNAPDRNWKASKLRSQLMRRYDSFVAYEGAPVEPRTKQQAEATAVLVLYVAIWMLILDKKVDKPEDHPYYSLINCILLQINQFPLFERMIAKTKQDEEYFEKITKQEIQPRDYLLDGALLFKYTKKDLPYQRKQEIDAEIRDSIIDTRPKVVVEKLRELQMEKKEISIPRGGVQSLCKYLNERYGKDMKPNSFSNAVDTYFPEIK